MEPAEFLEPGVELGTGVACTTRRGDEIEREPRWLRLRGLRQLQVITTVVVVVVPHVRTGESV